MRVTTKKATGVLARLLANIDEKEMARTRKRMMIAAKIEDAMKRRENELQKDRGLTIKIILRYGTNNWRGSEA